MSDEDEADTRWAVVKNDAETVELVRTCAAKIDDGLAPLVAAGIVHRDVARQMIADLLHELVRATGDEIWAATALPRTGAAIATLDGVAHAEQLSSAGVPCPLCNFGNDAEDLHCAGCGVALTNGAGA